MAKAIIQGVYQISALPRDGMNELARHYIGSSVDCYKRLDKHNRDLANGIHHSRCMTNLRDLGVRFEFKILLEVLDHRYLPWLERLWIIRLRSLEAQGGLNGRFWGGDARGYKHRTGSATEAALPSDEPDKLVMQEFLLHEFWLDKKINCACSGDKSSGINIIATADDLKVLRHTVSSLNWLRKRGGIDKSSFNPLTL